MVSTKNDVSLVIYTSSKELVPQSNFKLTVLGKPFSTDLLSNEGTEESLRNLGQRFDVKDLNEVHKSTWDIVVQDLQCFVDFGHVVGWAVYVL